jgi:hypothetical protein
VLVPPLVITPDDDVDLIPPLVVERDADPVAPSTAPVAPVGSARPTTSTAAVPTAPEWGSATPLSPEPDPAPTRAPIPVPPAMPPAPALPASPTPSGSVGGTPNGGRDGGDHTGPSAVLAETATPIALMFAGFVRLRSRAPAATDAAPLESPG